MIKYTARQICIFLVCFVLIVGLLLSGCNKGISQEEYDQLKFELSQTKQQLDNANTELSKIKVDIQETQQVFDSFRPHMDISVLLLENQKDSNLRRSGEITEEEYTKRADTTWTLLKKSLDDIGNKEMTDAFTEAWFAPRDTVQKYSIWAKAADLYITPIYDALSKLEQQFNKPD